MKNKILWIMWLLVIVGFSVRFDDNFRRAEIE